VQLFPVEFDELKILEWRYMKTKIYIKISFLILTDKINPQSGAAIDR